MVHNIRTADSIDLNLFRNAAGFNGTPDDIAGLVSYLASAESRFITGQSITIDGGIVFD